MPFRLRHEGNDILTIDEQVTGVRIQTSRGETSVTGVAPNEGVVDIIIDRVAPGGPPRLDQIEAQAMQAIRDRSEEGLPVGYARDQQVVSTGARADQGLHDETLREGGVDTSQQQGNHNPPSRDLAEGLSPKDTDILTARIEAFNESGDAEAAVNDNPPSGGEAPGTATDLTSEESGRSGEGVTDTSPLGGPANTPPAVENPDAPASDGGSASGPQSSPSEAGDTLTTPDAPGSTAPSTSGAPGLNLPGRTVTDSPQA